MVTDNIIANLSYQWEEEPATWQVSRKNNKATWTPGCCWEPTGGGGWCWSSLLIVRMNHNKTGDATIYMHTYD
jgi:hypothetical protein